MPTTKPAPPNRITPAERRRIKAHTKALATALGDIRRRIGGPADNEFLKLMFLCMRPVLATSEDSHAGPKATA
jgi:hypothetical protein